MLDYLILNNKKIVKKIGPDGYEERQMDLLTPVITSVDYPAIDLVIVNEYYIARPDLISLAVYGSDKYGDMICKYNGISNPFEMNEGDIIYIPDYTNFTLMMSDKFIASDFIEDQTKNTIVDKENKFQKDISETRSPAQQTIGESNYVIDKSMGVVFFK